MNERDIRAAFDHLRGDVIMNVETEERLEEIVGRPRTWRSPLGVALAGAAAAAVIVVGAVLLTGPGVDPIPVPPAGGGSSTSVVVTTTEVPVTTSTTESPGVTMPEARPGMVVIADLGVAAIEQGDGYIAYLADRVVGDGSGGIVVEVDQRLIRIESSGGGGDLVDAEDLAADQGTVSLRLEDVYRRDGSPHVLFTVRGGTFEEPYEEVWTYDLDTGAAFPIHMRQEFESNIQRASVGGDTMVLTIAEEGTTYLVFLDSEGNEIDVVNPFGPGAGTDFAFPIVGAVLSADGSTLAYAQIQNGLTGEEGFVKVDVVEWDVAAGVEIRRVGVEFLDGRLPGRFDYDGEGIVLGSGTNGLGDSRATVPPIRIASLADGTITQVGVAGSPSLIKR